MRVIFDTSIFMYANYHIYGLTDPEKLGERVGSHISNVVLKHFPTAEVVLAFDSPDNFRKMIDPQYKESRNTPFDREETHKHIKGFRTLQVNYLEGDDIIYLYTRKYPDAVIVSEDNDFMLMLGEGRKQFLYKKQEFRTLTNEEVLQEQILKVIGGCKSDNIPSIKNKPMGPKYVSKVVEACPGLLLSDYLNALHAAGDIQDYGNNYELAYYDIMTYHKYLDGIDYFVKSI